MNTKNIIQKCKKNHYETQLEVYHAYKNMMYSSALRILKNSVDAEDVVQDSFIVGFQKIHQLEEDANLGAWLKRIVINKSLDIIRNHKKTVWVEETLILKTESEDVNDEIENDLSIDYIKECINNLKEKYSIVLNLYMIEDYNHREIGELLQLKESTVRNQYKRGKHQLLQLIKNNKP